MGIKYLHLYLKLSVLKNRCVVSRHFICFSSGEEIVWTLASLVLAVRLKWFFIFVLNILIIYSLISHMKHFPISIYFFILSLRFFIANSSVGLIYATNIILLHVRFNNIHFCFLISSCHVFSWLLYFLPNLSFLFTSFSFCFLFHLHFSFYLFIFFISF